MTWEKFLANAIPFALIGLGGLVLKLWRSQAVTDVLIGQLTKDTTEIKNDLKVVTSDTGKIKTDVGLLTQAFDNFVRKNGGH